MESIQIEGHIYGIKEYSESVEITLAIPKNPPKSKGFEEMGREKQSEFLKSPAYLKAKAEIDKKITSLHLGKVTLTQDQ